MSSFAAVVCCTGGFDAALSAASSPQAGSTAIPRAAMAAAISPDRLDFFFIILIHL